LSQIAIKFHIPYYTITENVWICNTVTLDHHDKVQRCQVCVDRWPY